MQVALVAANTRFIADHQMGAAFLTGFGISWVWWANTGSAAREPGITPRIVYALGAALGTLAGMEIGGWLR